MGNNSKELRDSKEEASRVERNGESFDERDIISEGRDLWRDTLSKFKLEDDSRMERSSVLVNYLDSTEAD